MVKGCEKQFENVNSMEKVEIDQEMVEMQCRKMPNCKTWERWCARILAETFCIIPLTYSKQLNHILDGERPLPDYPYPYLNSIVPKDLAGGSAVDNYRPISCLHLMCKLMTGMWH